RDELLRDGVCSAPGAGRRRARSHLHTATRAAVRGAPRARLRVRRRGGARSPDAVSLETGLGVIPIALEREHGRIVFGRMQQVVPEWGPYEREVELLAALGVERSGLPVEAYPNGPRHVYVELESEEAVA